MRVVYVLAVDAIVLTVAINRFFYMHHPVDRIAQTISCVMPVLDHSLEQEIVQFVHNEVLIWHSTAPSGYSLGPTQKNNNLRTLKRKQIIKFN